MAEARSPTEALLDVPFDIGDILVDALGEHSPLLVPEVLNSSSEYPPKLFVDTFAAGLNLYHANYLVAGQSLGRGERLILSGLAHSQTPRHIITVTDAQGFQVTLGDIEHQARGVGSAIHHAAEKGAPDLATLNSLMHASAEQLLSDRGYDNQHPIHRAAYLLADASSLRKNDKGPAASRRRHSEAQALLHHFSPSLSAPPMALETDMSADKIRRIPSAYNQWAEHIGLPPNDPRYVLMKNLLGLGDALPQSFAQIVDARPGKADQLIALLSAHLEKFCADTILEPKLAVSWNKRPLARTRVVAAAPAAGSLALPNRLASEPLAEDVEADDVNLASTTEKGSGAPLTGMASSDEVLIDELELIPSDLMDEEDQPKPKTHKEPGAIPDDLVKLYMRETGKIDLLTAEGEVKLAKRIEAGLFAQEKLDSGEELKPAFRRELEIIALQGHNAKRHLIEANLRLVASVAKRYIGQGMLYSDLIQEGNLGLIRAVEKFDYTKGYKFSTYATWWLRQAMTRALADQARTIRHPAHVVEVMNKVERVKKRLYQENHEEATPEEIAADSGLDIDKVVEILGYLQRDPLSLDFAYEDESGDTRLLGDQIVDEDTPSPQEAIDPSLLAAGLEEVLATLGEREQRILRLRYGLDGEPHTLDSIAPLFGVTRERIRQIETKVLAKLRGLPELDHLREFFT